MKKMNRFVSFLLVLCMVLTALPFQAIAAEPAEAVSSEVQSVGGSRLESPLTERNNVLAEHAPEMAAGADLGSVTVEKIEKPAEVGSLVLQEQLQPSEELEMTAEETVRVIVLLEEKSLLEMGYSAKQILKSNAASAAVQRMTTRQSAVLAQINKVVGEEFGAKVTAKYSYTVAANGIAVEVPFGSIAMLREISGVKDVVAVPQYEVPEDMSEQTTAELHTYISSRTTGAVQAWDAGYDGEGMRIAIVDTGLDLDHPSFAADPENPSMTVEELAGVVGSLNAAKLMTGATAERLYRSEKVPYAFNYVDRSLDVTHDNDPQGDHGTHVAGIAAANRTEGTEAVGVAPDAQLFIMKVFGAAGGAFFDDILACLEDCYVLGVDVVNMSLGTPAGFSSVDPAIDEIFARVLESDMIAAIAAGNSNSAALLNGFGTDRDLTSNPDNGIVSSPATYVGATSVASVESPSVRFNFVELANGEKVPYNDVAALALTALYNKDPEHKAEYFMIPGYGDFADFDGIAPTVNEDGRRAYAVSIAVISRGGIDFTAKQTYAAVAGFDACIVYDNVEGDLLNMADAGLIPNVFASKESGAKMAAAADENGHGELFIKPADETTTVPSLIGGAMSDFSSWGVSPDLQLVPEVTAPGGNIYSTLNNGHYGTMSGTSMASPHIAGMSALILQYLNENYPDLSDSEKHTVAEALLMSTAEPVLEDEGVPYSPRKQGSGLANVVSAIGSPVYLTVAANQELTPKISFGDDDAKHGVYHFSFQLNNLSDTEQSFTLDGVALTDQVMELYGLEFMSETSRKLDAQVTFSTAGGALSSEYDYNADGIVDQDDIQDFLDAVNGMSAVKDGFDLNEDEVVDTADVQAMYELMQVSLITTETVTVPANGTATVYVTVTLSDADKAYMDAHYPNGIYVDGFVRAYAENAEAMDLSLPFMGFYGDWSQAPVFDSGWYYQQEEAMPSRYMNVLFTDYGVNTYNLGLNPYLVEEYDPAHNVLSPNGDGFLDSVNDMYLGMMRNAKKVDFSWYNEAGETLYRTGSEYVLKSYYMAQYGFPLPLVYSWTCAPYYFTGRDGYVVEDLDRVSLVIDGYLDDGDDLVDESIVTPVVIDTEAPVLDLDSLDYFYSEKTDSRMLKLTVSDNYDIAAIVPLTKGGAAFEYIPVTTKLPNKDGETYTLLLDVSDYDSTFQIAVCDYGCNESYYEITFSGETNYNPDSFFGYRLLAQIPSEDGYIYLTEGYNGWTSFQDPAQMLMHTSMFDENETYTYAAEYVDGYVIAIDANSTIYAVELGEWNRTDFGTLEADVPFEFYPGGFEVGDYYMLNAVFPALDMAFDYTTDTLYVLTDESMYLGPGTGGYLLTLDWITGEVTTVGRVSGLTDDHQALTLACDNDGVLYTVDAYTGDLYTLDKETAVATFVGATGYAPLYQQSMTVDHKTNKLYWAAYQDYIGQSYFFELDKSTGRIVSATLPEYNSQLAGLLKPYESGKDLVPDNAEMTSLYIKEGKLTMRPGDKSALHCAALPYNAELNTADIVWTTSNADVATVSGGSVTAVATGKATITATIGELSDSIEVEVIEVSGEVYLFDYGTDMSASNAWLKLDVTAPGRVAPVPGAMTTPNGFISAAYVDGNIYAYDSVGGFYRMDADTMRGEQISRSSSYLVMDMAFNYADGFMYALAYDGNAAFHLCQVNLYTGALRTVVNNLESMYGTPLGGMAIDYTGRFYFMNVDSMDNVKLDSFNIMYDGWMYMPMDYVTASLNDLDCYSFSSLLWSEKNNGLFWANDQGQLYWIGAQVESQYVESEWGGYEEMVLSASPILLGNIPGTVSATTGMAMIMGLLEIPENEPARPEVALDSATLVTSLTIPADGGTAKAAVSVEPWNAQYTVQYTSADPSVATVDAQGLVTGVVPGETTITAVVYDCFGEAFQTLTCSVTIVNSNVDLYMFMLSDGSAGGDLWLRVSGIDPDDVTQAAAYTSSMYAGAYYNGKVYGVGPAGEEYGYKNHLMRIDADTFSVEEIYAVELPFDIRDMAFDYTTGTMYGIAQGGENIGAVCQFNLTTGEATIVADSGTVIAAMSCDAEGQLFALTADGWLCKLDKYTGELTYINQATGPVSGYQSMHYDHVTGNTYWGYNALYLVDTVNGTMTSLGQIGGSYMLVNSVFTVPEHEPEIPANVDVTGVKLPERAAVVKGDTTQLTATVLPVSVSTVDQTVTWTSSDETIATVDANGVVSGIEGGVVTITATAGDYTASCTLTVLAEAQKFYAYDETTCRWVQINTETGELTTVKDEAGQSPIMAAADTGDAIYAFDDDGYFYEIDPVTFERTKIGDGIHGMTQDAFDGFSFYSTEVDVTDMSYDPETGHLFAILSGLYEDYNVGLYMVYNALVEINLQPGRMNPYTWEEMELGDIVFIETYDGSNGVYRPGNLLVKNGYAYSIDTWISGILCRVSVDWDPWMEFYYAGNREQLAHVTQLEWGMFFDSRSLVYDPVFDVTYTIHDLGLDELGRLRSNVTLCTINLGNASTSEVCVLGSGITINSLIIR